MLSCGNDRVPPSHGMWPLFCNEIGLSYDQEERVRSLQKQILSASESWLNRHTATSSEFVMHSAHDATVGSSELSQSRNQRVMNILTPEQKVNFFSWVAKKKETVDPQFDHLIRKLDAKLHLNKESPELEPCKDHHDAANLYIINHKLSRRPFPQTAPIIPQASIKKLSRRPLFESLNFLKTTCFRVHKQSYNSYQHLTKTSYQRMEVCIMFPAKWQIILYLNWLKKIGLLARELSWTHELCTNLYLLSDFQKDLIIPKCLSRRQ